MHFFYNLGIHLYHFAILLASPFNKKAHLWTEGRKNLFEKLFEINPQGKKLVWFHCASLGEFEQGRPLIEKFKEQFPAYKILLTFFSPSGYEIRKNYSLADHVLYLPIDTPGNSRQFVLDVKPTIAFIIKYEFWFNYLKELKEKNIPAFVVAANFRETHYFFKWYGAWSLKQLKNLTHIFVQNEKSLKLLQESGFNNVSVSGDTRFDRVYEIAQRAEELPVINQLRQAAKLVVAGSTWPDDEKIIIPAIQSIKNRILGIKLIIAPHGISDEKIENIEQELFSAGYKAIRYSIAESEPAEEYDALIIDNIGLLSRVYRYAHIAYIGGGFGAGIHNILEPAAHSVPVIFGPNHHKFSEAEGLIQKGGAFSITNEKELIDKLRFLLIDDLIRRIASEMCRMYVRENCGATERVIDFCRGKIAED